MKSAEERYTTSIIELLSVGKLLPRGVVSAADSHASMAVGNSLPMAMATSSVGGAPREKQPYEKLSNGRH